MENKFDSDNYPDQEPQELAVGARWAWTRSDITKTYPTASYTLKYKFSLLDSAGTVGTITATKSDSAHVVEVAVSTTESFAAGDYYWQAVIVRDSDSEEVVVDTGYWTLINDLDADVDTRSHNYKVLKAIESCIEGTATKDQQSYAIAGRSLSRRSIEELLMLKNEYRRLWNEEKREKRRKAGRNVNNDVFARFTA
jgi:hypothetical protein